MRYTLLFMLALFTLGCTPPKQTEEALEVSKVVVEQDDLSSGSCELYVNFLHPFFYTSDSPDDILKFITNPQEEDPFFDSLHVVYKDNTISYKYIDAIFLRIKKGYFVQLLNKYFFEKNDEYDIEIEARTNIHGQNQMWTKAYAHPLWDGAKDVVLLERDRSLLRDVRDVERIAWIRKHYYNGYNAKNVPLPSETKINHASVFNDNVHSIQMYDNVVTYYDGFMFANMALACFPTYDEDWECQEHTCYSQATQVVLDIDDRNALILKKHVSYVPEFYDGTNFKPIFSDPYTDGLKDAMIKKLSFFPETSRNRTFAFSPYAIWHGDDARKKEEEHEARRRKSLSGEIGIISVHDYSKGRGDLTPCYMGVYEGCCCTASGKIIDDPIAEQSSVYGIPYSEVPDTIKPIIQRITHAPNGCGYIDWDKRELVFGDKRFSASWLHENISGIYWLEPGEEIPFDRLVPNPAPTYVDWKTFNRSEYDKL